MIPAAGRRRRPQRRPLPWPALAAAGRAAGSWPPKLQPPPCTAACPYQRRAPAASARTAARTRMHARAQRAGSWVWTLEPLYVGCERCECVENGVDGSCGMAANCVRGLERCKGGGCGVRTSGRGAEQES
eukprot:360564-Chlamydomonas_euryale.AAC.1